MGLHPMANEYPVLKTSASGHVECSTSRLGGGAGWDWTLYVCAKGGSQCLIRLQSQKNKTSGHTETIWSWRIIDFHPKWIDAQRRHKHGNICALKAARDASGASHNILCKCTFPAPQQYGMLTLISEVDYVIFHGKYRKHHWHLLWWGSLDHYNTQDIVWVQTKLDLQERMSYNFNSTLYCLY